MIHLKRVYDHTDTTHGKQFLVERLWPRGIKKESLEMEAWLKDVAPSTALRTWFGHDPAKWEEFKTRYIAELEDNHEAWKPLLDEARKGAITLLYSSHDEEHNNALALKSFLEKQLKK